MTLPRRAPLNTRTPLKRTGRLRPMSAKRRKVNRARRRLTDDRLDEPCRLRTEVCTGWAESWHELVGRAQGGSLVDLRNLVPACHRCNGWVEDNPGLAWSRGLKVRAFDSTEGEGGRVPASLSPICAVWAWNGGGDAA